MIMAGILFLVFLIIVYFGYIIWDLLFTNDEPDDY